MKLYALPALVALAASPLAVADEVPDGYTCTPEEVCLAWDAPTSYATGHPLAPETITKFTVYVAGEDGVSTVAADDIPATARSWRLVPPVETTAAYSFVVTATADGVEGKRSNAIVQNLRNPDYVPAAPVLRTQIVQVTIEAGVVNFNLADGAQPRALVEYSGSD